MIFDSVVIHQMNHESPPEAFSSDFIENRLSSLYSKLKLPTGRLELMTGIKERKHFSIETRPSQIATRAAQKVLSKSSIPKSEIDLLIFTSVCRDFLEPATASIVHNNLELPSTCMFFDLSNACLGMVNGMHVAASMIEKGQVRSALVVSGENGRSLLEQTVHTLLNDKSITRKTIKKYIANLTIGSAGVAYLLTHKDIASGYALEQMSFLTDSKASHLCQGGGGMDSLMMETDSEELLHAGIALAKESWRNVEDEIRPYNHIITHQVGIAHEKLLFDSLNLDLKSSIRSYPEFGNTGSAALPLTLSLAEEQKVIANGERVLLLGIGSGLSTCVAQVRKMGDC